MRFIHRRLCKENIYSQGSTSTLYTTLGLLQVEGLWSVVLRPDWAHHCDRVAVVPWEILVTGHLSEQCRNSLVLLWGVVGVELHHPRVRVVLVMQGEESHVSQDPEVARAASHHRPEQIIISG